MKDAYFRLVTTVFGIVVKDTWKAYQYHLNHKHWENSMGVINVTYILSNSIP